MSTFCNLSIWSCDTSRGLLKTAVLGMVFSAGITAIANFIRLYLFVLAGEKFVARLRKMLMIHILRQEIALFDVTQTGSSRDKGISSKFLENFFFCLI